MNNGTKQSVKLKFSLFYLVDDQLSYVLIVCDLNYWKIAKKYHIHSTTFHVYTNHFYPHF